MCIRGHMMLICLVYIVVQWTLVTCQSTVKRFADVDVNEYSLAKELVEIKNILNDISRDQQLHKETAKVLNV
jgi:hypothetical protein